MAYSNKKIFTVFIVMLVSFLVLFNLFMFKDDIFYRPNDNLEEVGIRNFKGIENLKLTGEVYDVHSGIGNYHGTGILRINIVETNIDYYDPRDRQANYYCIIKNDKAEIYESELTEVKKGDTILIDIENGATKIYNSIKGKYEEKATIIYPRRFFDFIKRKGYQEI